MTFKIAKSILSWIIIFIVMALLVTMFIEPRLAHHSMAHLAVLYTVSSVIQLAVLYGVLKGLNK